MTQDQLLRGEERWELTAQGEAQDGAAAGVTLFSDVHQEDGHRLVSPASSHVSHSHLRCNLSFHSSVHNPYLGKSPGGEFIFAASGRRRCRDAGPRALWGELPSRTDAVHLLGCI